MADIHTLSVADCSAKLEAGEITSVELCQALLERTKKYDEKIGSFLHLDEAGILDQAKASDERRKGGQSLGPLDGVPLAIKDNINIEGWPTSCASNILDGYVSPYDATAITKLKEHGLVFFGKTNLDEFAMGGSTENSAKKVCRNPFNLEKVPGGSSGGSAAAVAAGFAPASLGSDTGGSIRQPAAFCGLYGLKPTYGRVSRYGLVAFGSSLDQIGPIAKSPKDLALILDAMTGDHGFDSTAYTGEHEGAVEQMEKVQAGYNDGRATLGFLKLDDGIDTEIVAAYDKLKAAAKDKGFTIKEIELPHAKYGIAVYYLLATSEASTNLARFDGVRYGNRQPAKDLGELYTNTKSKGFGPEVKRRILLGSFALSAGYYDAYYKKAGQVRTLIRRDFAEVFKDVDIIVTPTTPEPAFGIGQNTGDPLQMYLGDLLTVGANLAGIPGLNIPYTKTESGLPIGMQLLGRHFDEGKLLALAETLGTGTAMDYPNEF